MDIKDHLIKLDDSIRQYCTRILLQQQDLINENNRLKDVITILKSNIYTLQQQIRNLELAFLGNKAVYDKLNDEYTMKKIDDNDVNIDNVFLNLSHKSKLKQIRKKEKIE